jgi:tetratricopeptide (TPR) repeat protein
MIEISREALRIGSRLRDDRMNAALRHGAIGSGHARLGRTGPALRHLRMRLQLAIEMRDSVGIASCLHLIGMVKWRAGLADVATARRMVSAGLRLMRSAGYAIGESECLSQLARLKHTEGQTGAALELVSQAIAIAERIGHRRYEALYRADRAEFLLAAGDVSEARESCADALRLADKRYPYEWAVALSGRAAVHLAEDEPEAARRLWEQALTMFNRMGVPDRREVEQRLAELDGGTDQLRTSVGGGRMEG